MTEMNRFNPQSAWRAKLSTPTNSPSERGRTLRNPQSVYAALLASLCILLSGCAKEEQQPQIAWDVTFFSLGAKIHFDDNRQKPIQRIRVFDAADGLVAQLDLGGYPRSAETLYFRWTKGETYRFEIAHNGDRSTTQFVQAPQTDLRGSIEIAIPYGTAAGGKTVTPKTNAVAASTVKTQSELPSLVLIGSKMNMTVLVRNGLEAPVTFRVVLQIPSSIQVVKPPAIWEADETLGHDSTSDETGAARTMVASGRFTVESEVWYSQLTLRMPDERLQPSTQIRGHVFFAHPSGDRWEQSITVPVRSATVDEIAQQLSIEDVIMPTDGKGVFDPRQRPDAIYYSRPLLPGFAGWFGNKERINEFQPVAYQTVRLRNRSQNTIHAIVASLNREPKHGEPVAFLAPPAEISAGTNRSLAFVSLTGNSSTDVPLPIYFNPINSTSGDVEASDRVGAGRYERAIEVKIWGSDATVLQTTRPLLIVTPNLHALLVTGFAICATSMGLLGLLRFHQWLFSRFSTKQLIQIALFGATIFIAVSIPSTLLSNLIVALLGPISFLFTGLINEVLYYSLLTSLLMLIRKPGVITLVSGVRFLLGGVMLGLFTPGALLHLGMTVLLLEGGFQIARSGEDVWRLAPIFGICDALAVYVDLQLSITLYRLFYADWYILTRLLVDGFAYTFIGVLLGKQLGHGLWRVTE